MTASGYCRFIVTINLALEYCLQEHPKSVWTPAVPQAISCLPVDWDFALFKLALQTYLRKRQGYHS